LVFCLSAFGPAALARSPKAAPPPGESSIAEIAIAAGFDELVGALVYVDTELGTGLVDLFLNGTDQYTVFAPTNEAFENLYAAQGVGGIEDLDAELVLAVLLYHVTEGRRAANSVVPPVRPREITTLLGETFTVDKDAVITDIAGQQVGIVAANISASNGIIHVVDTVLLPIPPQ
jgi:transforming growth factor-beta-induced protein